LTIARLTFSILATLALFLPALKWATAKKTMGIR
jgi:hypothetical protein